MSTELTPIAPTWHFYPLIFAKLPPSIDLDLKEKIETVQSKQVLLKEAVEKAQQAKQEIKKNLSLAERSIKQIEECGSQENLQAEQYSYWQKVKKQAEEQLKTSQQHVGYLDRQIKGIDQILLREATRIPSQIVEEPLFELDLLQKEKARETTLTNFRLIENRDLSINCEAGIECHLQKILHKSGKLLQDPETPLEAIHRSLARLRLEIIFKTLLDAVQKEDFEMTEKYLVSLENEDKALFTELKDVFCDICIHINAESKQDLNNHNTIDIDYPGFGYFGFCHKEGIDSPKIAKIQAINEIKSRLSEKWGVLYFSTL